MKRMLICCIAGLFFINPAWAAIDLEGDNDYVDIPSTSRGDLNPVHITVSAWVYDREASQDCGVITMFNGGADYAWIIYVTGANKEGHGVKVGGTLYLMAQSATVINQWYLSSMTYDGETLIAYRNGVEIDRDTDPSGDIEASSHDVWIGAYVNTTAVFNGIISEAGVWDRALSPGEIKDLYYRRHVPDSGTKGYWRLDEGALNLAPGGLDCTDISGNGHHGTAEASMTDSDYVDGPPIQWNQGD